MLSVRFTLLLLAMIAVPCFAAEIPRDEDDLDPDDLTTFVDQLITDQLSHRHVPGAAFAWVENGRVRVLRGYGISDARSGDRVDPNHTIFQVGSLSKPLTTMAALKLSHDYKLDRSKDLRPLLPELPPRVTDAPITMHRLLTHTSGFDPVFVDIGVTDPMQLLDLKDYLRLRTPPRKVVPGQMVLYNNFGFSLAGRVIERVSGVSFANYMQQQLLEPLGMRDSSFAPRKYETLAHGHDWINGTFVPVRSLYLNDTPASGFTTTAADMAKFLIEVLGGADASPAVLCEEDLQLMHTRQFAHHPQLEGLTYGFAERTIRGERALEHGGVWNGFTCKIFMLPDRHAGFFVVYNRYEPKILDEITQPLVDHRYPRAETAATKRAETDTQVLSSLLGEYRNTYYAHGTIEKLRVLWKSPARVFVDEHGELVLQEPNEGAKRLHQVEDLLFTTRSRQPSVSFRRNEAGEITHLFVGTTAYERQHWWDASRLHIVLVGAFTSCFVALAPVMVGRWGWALLRRRRVTLGGALLRAGVALCAVSNAIFMVALARMLVNYETRDLVYGLPSWMMHLLNLPMIAACCATFAVALVVDSIRRRESMSRVIRHAFFAILAVGFIPLLAYWNLLIPTY